MNPKNPKLIEEMALNMKGVTAAFLEESFKYRYTYNFTWMGRPVIQYPQDLIAVQQIIFETKPELIIETGTAHGGLTVFCASIAKAIIPDVEVISIDVDLREHNKEALDVLIKNHNLPITFLKGSSVDSDVIEKLNVIYHEKEEPNVLVLLDSCHTKDHVSQELGLYSKYCSPGNYIVVFDTLLEFTDKKLIPDRPWGPGNSPYGAVCDFIGQNKNFVIDAELSNELLITNCPGGFLKRI